MAAGGQRGRVARAQPQTGRPARGLAGAVEAAREPGDKAEARRLRHHRGVR